MLKLIGDILLVYYLVLGGAVLIFLAWGCIDDCRRTNRCRYNLPVCGARDARRTRPWQEREHPRTQKAKGTGGDADNVVTFKRHHK
jgi:hypothetical protein